MDIRKLIKEHNEYIWTSKNDEEFMENHSSALEILKHERMIHMIITMFVSLFAFVFLGLFLMTQMTALAVIFWILLIVMVFYYIYYFQLENTTLEWEGMLYEKKRGKRLKLNMTRIKTDDNESDNK